MAAQNYDNLNKIGIVFQGKGICFFLKNNSTRHLFFQKTDTKNRKNSIFEANLREKKILY